MEIDQANSGYQEEDLAARQLAADGVNMEEGICVGIRYAKPDRDNVSEFIIGPVSNHHRLYQSSRSIAML